MLRYVNLTLPIESAKARQALLMARDSSETPEKAVEESTRRIAFFVTPFKGSVTAKWGDVVRQVFSLWNETNHELLRDLQEDCSKLANLRDEFPGWLRQREVDKETKVQIICYAEAKSTGSVDRVRETIIMQSSTLLNISRSCRKTRLTFQAINSRPSTPTTRECANFRARTIRTTKSYCSSSRCGWRK